MRKPKWHAFSLARNSPARLHPAAVLLWSFMTAHTALHDYHELLDLRTSSFIDDHYTAQDGSCSAALAWLSAAVTTLQRKAAAAAAGASIEATTMQAHADGLQQLYSHLKSASTTERAAAAKQSFMYVLWWMVATKHKVRACKAGQGRPGLVQGVARLAMQCC